MQSYNNPAPPPPAQKGIPPGVKILILVLALVVLGGVLLVGAGVGVFYWFRHDTRGDASEVLHHTVGIAGPIDGVPEAVAPPQPTAAQQAALAGGQPAEWEQQGMSWTVPRGWSAASADGGSLMWRSPGGWDAASLIANVSPTAADFPTRASLRNYYDGFRAEKQKYSEVDWLGLDGVTGVVFREAAPESADRPQRLQWLGYRYHEGQKQLVSIMLAAPGKDFARHQDEMYAILYSTKLRK